MENSVDVFQADMRAWRVLKRNTQKPHKRLNLKANVGPIIDYNRCLLRCDFFLYQFINYDTDTDNR